MKTTGQQKKKKKNSRADVVPMVTCYFFFSAAGMKFAAVAVLAVALCAVGAFGQVASKGKFFLIL